MDFYSVALPSLACLLVLLWRLGQVGRRPKGYPPGPPTLPLIGNLHQMPKHQPHKQLEAWAREYGPIYSLILGTRVMIVLSSDQVVKDLLDKRSAIYSSRPDAYIGQNILSGGLRVLFMKYGKELQKMRKLAGQVLNMTVSKVYIPYQDVESKAMLVGMLDRSDLFIDHVRRYTASLTTQMTFGFRIVNEEDPTVKKMFYIFERFSELCGSQTATLLDIYPILRWLPDLFLPVVREGRRLHRMEYDLFTSLFRETKESLLGGKFKPCFCVDIARHQVEHGISDGQAGYIGGSFLQAGSETASAILVGFIQAMVIYPDVARRAQEELDRVCGPDRIPDLPDAPSLPYIRGCVKEAMRWMPTALLGLPHALDRDDAYRGFLLPKGATVIYNVWAIHNDPARHANPRLFDPTRWAGDDQTAAEAARNPDVTQRDHFVFGAGRRLCQGMHLAERSLYLGIARLLWTFDFGRQVGPVTTTTTTSSSSSRSGGSDGGEIKKEIVPDMDDLTEGLFVLPRPFAARIVPRDPDRARHVREEWARIEKELLDGQGQWKGTLDGLVWTESK